MSKQPEEIAHLEWLGYVQPTGLVVSIPAILSAQCFVNKNILPEHQRFLNCLPRDKHDEVIPEIQDFTRFVQEVFDWRTRDLVGLSGGDSIPPTLQVALPEYNETLHPTFAVPETSSTRSAAATEERKWLLLIQHLPTGASFDKETDDTRHWQATPQAKFERLLRETQVPIGLLVNGTHLRLVYAPRGESSGFATFAVADMAKVAGRPIFAAMHMLLCADRLFTLGERQRLPAILAESRRYQSVVSTKLAEQVLAALYELLRGFQSAHEQSKGELLKDVLAEAPNHVYAGLLTVLMRSVFVLYAEDRDLLSHDSVFTNHYSLAGLFKRLRSDAGRYPDTMDQRFGAWAQLLTLFRMIHEGGSHGEFRIPGRKGYLFDPDRYNFLEGRQWKTVRRHHDGPVNVPRVSDGVIYRVLNNLLILDGERLSYRTLDVEQIGSVYEKMMGFELHIAAGRSIAIKPKKSSGAPAAINLEELLAVAGSNRAKWLKEKTDQELTGKAADALKQAQTIEELLAALDRRIANDATPNVVPKGAMMFQPSDERRRSGSHYTPRSLTEPIVRTTLRPVLEQLGDSPTPQQLLDLKICDPAMGSAAFLVEACRQLGDELVKAWHVHRCLPKLPPDEDEVLHARRLIAQRCLYGVDKNPMAVDLGKLSLWLATLAKDHPFTFLDHALRHGDSLVGLTKEQIIRFHWQPVTTPAKKPKKGTPTQIAMLFADPIAERMQRVTEFRQKILAARDDVPYEQLRQQLDYADEQLSLARLAGDLVVSAYFSADKDAKRETRLNELSQQLVKYISPQGKIDDRKPLTEAVTELRSGDRPIEPFHWWIEFPEVFDRERGGFDGIVGNPPFLGGKRISTVNGDCYRDWLVTTHSDSNSNSDLVAHFFRRAFGLLRPSGCFGLIATNTIGQGDTRLTGLRWICLNGGTIYAARSRYKWPGEAAVTVSILHVSRSVREGAFCLDDRVVPIITAYLFHAGGHDNPAALGSNSQKSFIGCFLRGMGFTFDNSDSQDSVNSIETMRALIQADDRNVERLFPYIGGEEVNESPTHSHHRFVINFGNMTEVEASRWPQLLSLLREKVKPERDRLGASSVDRTHKLNWWRFANDRPEMTRAITSLDRVLVISRVTQHVGFTFLPAGMVYSEQLVVFADSTFLAFSILQSRLHELWARFFSSSLEDRLRYTPSDCLETFPFPAGVLEHSLEAIRKGFEVLIPLRSMELGFVCVCS
ncbi:MAG: Eco57I restriction-modification methylase domain-containing protein [Planctomycetaceae bacterium]